ncbi:hypothetical protein MPH_12630 [Macrophomina phaseolina MS6]|uniref:Uncharacterized protein n=1 Tax=Macrophomina phaseolina (strain MS6) TaxID=1126212 RepID=K2R7G6_MACPH|nr:hypothetical protein MPH_12630 [Macrophomina phaseolina MS6]
MNADFVAIGSAFMAREMSLPTATLVATVPTTLFARRPALPLSSLMPRLEWTQCFNWSNLYHTVHNIMTRWPKKPRQPELLDVVVLINCEEAVSGLHRLDSGWIMTLNGCNSFAERRLCNGPRSSTASEDCFALTSRVA